MFSPSSVLVTGANRGIGLEFIMQLVGLNPAPKHVFAACRDPDSAQDLKEVAAKNASVVLLKIDVNDEATIEAAVKAVGERVGEAGLACLINNAGLCSYETLDEMNKQQMMDVFSVNCVGTLLMSKAFLPLLRQAASSSCDKSMSFSRAGLINISTIIASITNASDRTQYAYRSSKAAMNMVTKMLSVDLKPDGIIVTMVHPGWVQTKMGGPGALIDTHTSVSSMLKEFAKLQGEDQTGKFIKLDGEELPF